MFYLVVDGPNWLLFFSKPLIANDNNQQTINPKIISPDEDGAIDIEFWNSNVKRPNIVKSNPKKTTVAYNASFDLLNKPTALKYGNIINNNSMYSAFPSKLNP